MSSKRNVAIWGSVCDNNDYKAIKLWKKNWKKEIMELGPFMHKHPILDLVPLWKWYNTIYFNFYSHFMIKGSLYGAEMFFVHEKEANSILTKGGLKHLVAVTPSIVFVNLHLFPTLTFFPVFICICA